MEQGHGASEDRTLRAHCSSQKAAQTDVSGEAGLGESCADDEGERVQVTHWVSLFVMLSFKARRYVV